MDNASGVEIFKAFKQLVHDVSCGGLLEPVSLLYETEHVSVLGQLHHVVTDLGLSLHHEVIIG